MKRKVGTEPEGGTKKRKEVGNDNNFLFVSFISHLCNLVWSILIVKQTSIQCTTSKRKRNGAQVRRSSSGLLSS
jgi:hypothetical protein